MSLRPMLRAGAIEDEEDTRPSPLDELFAELEMSNPDHIALKYYRSYHSGAAKTLKSIQITLAARLEKFNLESLASLTTTDELDLPSLGEKKVALFALIPDNDSSFNFLVSILYTQLFQQLLPHFSCHSLRHTFTTRMCEAGVNVKVIQDTLGHKDISTTLNIYTDVTKELRKSEFEGLDSYFKNEYNKVSV